MNKRLKIGMVLDQRFPPDARVEREAMALAQAGFEVHLLCELHPDQDPYPGREQYYQGIYIHRVHPQEVSWSVPLLNTRTRLPYKGMIKNAYRSLLNIDTVWQTLMDRFTYAYGLDALHIHDLRLVTTGLHVADKYKIPLVADLHEHYPALMAMLKGRHNAEKGVKVREKWENIEKNCAWQADRVITVIEEARDRIVAKGVNPKRVVVLPNTVDHEKFEAASVDPSVTRRFKSSFLLTYVGFINGQHRGIHTVIEALAQLKEEIPEIFFVAAGGARDDYMAQLQALISQHHLERHVAFTGWLDETEFVSYIDAADICVCPHMANDHTNATFPNKVYLYNLLARPVLVSSCKPLQRYINESGGGLSFESGNATDLANQIRKLYYDKALRKQLAEQGRQAVLQEYNWNATAERLVDMYQELLGHPAPVEAAPQAALAH